MITQEDVNFFFFALLQAVLMAFIISRVLTFVPSLILSVVRSIKNRSLIYQDGKALDTTLDKSDFGLKVLVNRWFK